MRKHVEKWCQLSNVFELFSAIETARELAEGQVVTPLGAQGAQQPPKYMVYWEGKKEFNTVLGAK